MRFTINEQELEQIFARFFREASQYEESMERARANKLKKIEDLCRRKHAFYVKRLKKLTRIAVRNLMIEELCRPDLKEGSLS